MNVPCAECAKKHQEEGKSGVAWVPVLTVLGVAAAAVVLAKRLRERAGPLNLDTMLDRCDRAAEALEERLNGERIAIVR